MTSIAIIGGTGPEGRGLGLRFALAGHAIIIGSRDFERASKVASELRLAGNDLLIEGNENLVAAKEAEFVVLSTPYSGIQVVVRDLQSALAGKLLISVVAPLDFSEGRPRSLIVPDGSAAELVKNMLPGVSVVSAFHNLSAHDLLIPDHEIDGDVVVCGDKESDRLAIMGLAESIKSLRAIDGGPLDNSRYAEDMTALLLHINRKYKTRSTIKFLGV
jgi:NADPH-dependent F420 reductase